MKKADVEEMFRVLSAINPEPKTELEYESAYTLLVAVALSAQSTDVGVNKATKSLFAVANTPEKMVSLGVEGVKDHIRTLGLFNNKAKNVVALSQILLDQYEGDVPQDRDILETLPGVGRKTANVVMNEAFGQPTIAVDTHIFRVGNRTGLAKGKTPLAVELKLEKAVPSRYLLGAHHWLILHGRYICKARKPECWRCTIVEQCAFKPKTPDPVTEAQMKAALKAASKVKKKTTKSPKM